MSYSEIWDGKENSEIGKEYKLVRIENDDGKITYYYKNSTNSSTITEVKETLDRKVIHARNFGILGEGLDYSTEIQNLLNYLEINPTDEVIFEPNGVLHYFQ